jgi:SSS family solute:Na+ symporter
VELALGIGLVVFFALMVGISLWARTRIETGEDYIVAGRQLSGIMTTATIMATWYAAETILVTADAVRSDGLRVTALEPIGIGICLILAGLVYARRMWNTQAMTLADVIGSRFGPATEKLQAVLTISYIGWVAVQLIGLAGVFEVFLGLPLSWGIVLLTVVLTAYTLIGGMWSVALTDIVQLGLLLIGIVVLTVEVLATLAPTPWGGLVELATRTDDAALVLLPLESFESLQTWVGLIVIGIFGNLASQDLAQRMFSARSADTAARSCLAAGVLYIIFGAFPVALGLAADLLLDESVTVGVIPALAEAMLSPTMAVLFALTLTAAVTSSVDSGLLAPASVLAKNLLYPALRGRFDLLVLTRWCVVAVGLGSAGMALSGVRAFELIQGTYALGIPGFVLLSFALFQRETAPLPGILTLGVGVALWVVQIGSKLLEDEPSGEIFSPGFPVILLVVSFTVYVVSDRIVKARR